MEMLRVQLRRYCRVRRDPPSELRLFENRSAAKRKARCAFRCLLASLLCFISPVCTSAQSATSIPFTADGIRSIQGKDVCGFRGTFPDQLGVYLDRGKKHSVEYRQRDGIIAVFLLSDPSDRCGLVDAALDLTPVIRKGETIQFKCYTSHEGGTTWGKWGHVIGLADNRNGLRRYVRARLAWRVNVEEKRFEELEREPVTCDTTGYAD